MGTTTISWTTADGSEGQVYVSENGQAEQLFASKTPQGSSDAPWIQAGRSYEFRLYDAAHAKLLSKVVVTRTTRPEATAAAPPSAQTGPTIRATPNPVPAASGMGTATIIWTTGDGSEGQVYVSENGQAEQLFSSNTPQGSGDAPWIQAGRSYEFRLYDAAHAKLLGKVVVTRAEH